MTPRVSIIVPCLNEEATIRALLDSILAQTYPRASMEVIISDGLSADGTRERIASFQAEHPDLALRVVDNPARIIPAALNRGIQAARGEILVRLDGHSMPYPEYVACCVATLDAGRGDNVGGVWEVRPGSDTGMARGIAAAAMHPLGVGDALYRLSPRAGAVDTVPFGAFRREIIEKIGGFDERLLSNEDYEFNARVRRSGGTVWLDPSIRSVYFARSTLGELARQYWRYGYWKSRMLRRYPGTLRWRQALPPLFTGSLLALGVLSLWLPAARLLLAAEALLYLLVLIAAGVAKAFQDKSPSLILVLPLAIATMHVAWGSGFLWSLLTGLAGKHD